MGLVNLSFLKQCQPLNLIGTRLSWQVWILLIHLLVHSAQTGNLQILTPLLL